MGQWCVVLMFFLGEDFFDCVVEGVEHYFVWFETVFDYFDYVVDKEQHFGYILSLVDILTYIVYDLFES